MARRRWNLLKFWRMCVNGKHHAFRMTNGVRRSFYRLLPSDQVTQKEKVFPPSSSQTPWRNCNVHSTTSLKVKRQVLRPIDESTILVWFWHWFFSFFFFFFQFQPKATRAGDEKHRKKSTWPNIINPGESDCEKRLICHFFPLWHSMVSKVDLIGPVPEEETDHGQAKSIKRSGHCFMWWTFACTRKPLWHKGHRAFTVKVCPEASLNLARKPRTQKLWDKVYGRVHLCTCACVRVVCARVCMCVCVCVCVCVTSIWLLP